LSRKIVAPKSLILKEPPKKNQGKYSCCHN
jgi:hypothetical protein